MLNYVYLSIATLIMLMSTFHCVNGHDWRESADAFWAANCDLAGNDLSSKVIPGEQCSNECGRTAGCTHFTWTAYNGGTCWMKKNKIARDQATWNNGGFCGVMKLTARKKIDWHEASNDFWSEGCDWVGNDLSSKTIPVKQCSGECKRTSECTHFTWTAYNGGTCWMKKNKVEKNQAISSNGGFCGVLKSTAQPISQMCSLFPQNCRDK